MHSLRSKYDYERVARSWSTTGVCRKITIPYQLWYSAANMKTSVSAISEPTRLNRRTEYLRVRGYAGCDTAFARYDLTCHMGFPLCSMVIYYHPLKLAELCCQTLPCLFFRIKGILPTHVGSWKASRHMLLSLRVMRLLHYVLVGHTIPYP